MAHRIFKLLNGKGQEYELTNQDIKVFGHNPSGLGYTNTLSVFRLGDENLLTYSLTNLDTINLEILFYDETNAIKYQKYKEFVSFLSYKPLYLLYQTPDIFSWYRRQVEVLELSKTEVDYNDSMLHCNLSLQCLTFWEDNETNERIVNNDQVGGKTYPIVYPINYGFNSLSRVDLVSSGLLETPLQIEINGETTNPEIILYDDNDNIKGRAKFLGTFDSVYINSRETEEDIKLIRNDLVLDNPLGYQDLTIGSPNEIYITFLKLGIGRNRLAFFLGNDFNGNV